MCDRDGTSISPGYCWEPWIERKCQAIDPAAVPSLSSLTRERSSSMFTNRPLTNPPLTDVKYDQRLD